MRKPGSTPGAPPRHQHSKKGRTMPHNTATMTREEGRGGLRSAIEKQLAQMKKAGVPILWYHTYRSDRSPAGFPDYVIVWRPKHGPGRMLVRELKSSTGRVTPAQQEWLDCLAQAGQDVGVWRPADWESGLIARELTQLCTPVGVAA